MNLSIKLEFKIIRRLFKTFQEGLNGFFHGREEEENYWLKILKKKLFNSLTLIKVKMNIKYLNSKNDRINIYYIYFYYKYWNVLS